MDQRQEIIEYAKSLTEEPLKEICADFVMRVIGSAELLSRQPDWRVSVNKLLVGTAEDYFRG